ncbi:MAG: hypothetical protein E6K82_19695 [Candidatus Rokuibacteriota bacterium]|nr:MAG: hypothetical protein E6K82_19695 [Candidatus Rokubacteria bacterium]
MNTHAISYPSLQRRLIAERRSRALFLPRTTQHLRSASLAVEVARALVALTALAAWGAVLFVVAG